MIVAHPASVTPHAATAPAAAPQVYVTAPAPVVLVTEPPKPVLPVQPPAPVLSNQQAKLSTSIPKWLDGVPENFFDGVPVRDRDVLERVYESLASLMEEDGCWPTEVQLLPNKDPARGVLWYDCVAYGYIRPIPLNKLLTLQQSFGQLVRGLQVCLHLQGTKQQSRGGLVVQIWCHSQMEQMALQQAQQTGPLSSNNKRGRTANGEESWAQSFWGAVKGITSLPQ